PGAIDRVGLWWIDRDPVICHAPIGVIADPADVVRVECRVRAAGRGLRQTHVGQLVVAEAVIEGVAAARGANGGESADEPGRRPREAAAPLPFNRLRRFPRRWG